MFRLFAIVAFLALTSVTAQAAEPAPDDAPAREVTIREEEGGKAATRRAQVRAAMNRERLASCGRLVPRMVGGQPSGWKLFAMKDGTWCRQAGFQNGDAVLTVNGHDARSALASEAIDAFLARGGQLVFGLERKGKPLTLTIIVP
jgi:type II secretory pathway component PulC